MAFYDDSVLTIDFEADVRMCVCVCVCVCVAVYMNNYVM